MHACSNPATVALLSSSSVAQQFFHFALLGAGAVSRIRSCGGSRFTHHCRVALAICITQPVPSVPFPPWPSYPLRLLLGSTLTLGRHTTNTTTTTTSCYCLHLSLDNDDDHNDYLLYPHLATLRYSPTARLVLPLGLDTTPPDHAKPPSSVPAETLIAVCSTYLLFLHHTSQHGEHPIPDHQRLLRVHAYTLARARVASRHPARC